MKREELTLVFRDQRTGSHSIERLFAALEPTMAKEFKLTKITIPCRPSNPISLLKNIIYARRRARGIIHITGDAQYLAGFLPANRVVLTIHDCGYLMKLKGLKRLLFLWIWYRIPCYRAALITTISESTKEVLQREVGLSPDKIRLVENCLTGAFSRTKRKFDSDCPRILQIGTGKHKNLDTLIKAVKGMNCELVIIGKVSEENQLALERYKIRHQNEFNISDHRLHEIYGECDILFFASRHEGFGLPIIEAQTVGIPVLTSTVYSMPHVAGKGAILVNPESVSDIRNALDQIIGNPNLRGELVSAGLKNSQRFSVSSIANEYLRAYRQI